MRHAFEKAQRRSDDRAERLEGHIRQRLPEKFPIPERAAAAKLRTLEVAEITAVVLETLPYAISTEADWWRTCEILARALGVADELDTEARLRVGNLALNFAADALPDLFSIDYEADHAPRITPRAEGRLLAARPEINAAHEPQTEPPAPWDEPKVDGQYFVRSPHPEVQEAVRAAFADGSIRPHARAVTALQSVPLLINPPILDCLKHYDEYAAGIEHIPPKAPPTHRNAWWQRQLQGRHRSLRLRFDCNMGTATRLLGRPFYIQSCCDTRGRLIPITDIHFAREDTIRGLLLFARAKPVGEDGIRRLKIQVATTGGFNRADDDARAAWCDDNMGWIRLIARLPKWRLSQRRLRQAKEPTQHLAACMELIAALDAGPTFETRLPCTIDATASGYQILALMRRATEEAALVNLVPNLPPQDFYGQVAGELDALLQKEYFSENPETGLFTEWALSSLKIDRDLVKANVMTKVYGADEGGAMTTQNLEQKQIEALMAAEPRLELYGGLQPKLPEATPVVGRLVKFDLARYIGRKYGQRARRLAKYISEATKKLMPRAHETMEWLQEFALALAKRGKFIRWRTPSGFPFVNCYRNQIIRRPRFLIGAQPRQKKIIVGWGGARLGGDRNVKSAVVANTAHACDAALLMLTVNAARLDGIHDIVSVHDCYGSHASDVERVREIILGQLRLMFEHRDVLREIWNEGDAYGPPPPREAFDWDGLLKAKHAFS
jgi:DNA-directed RNA polymerase